MKTFVATAIFSSFSTGNPSVIWSCLNTAQIISYIPLHNIDLSTNVYRFFYSLQIRTIVPNIWNITDTLSCDLETINEFFRKYGYKCNNFIFNTGEITAAFVVSLLTFPLLFLTSLIAKGRVKEFLKKKFKEIKWNFFLRFWIEAYIDIVIPTVISFNIVSFT